MNFFKNKCENKLNFTFYIRLGITITLIYNSLFIMLLLFINISHIDFTFNFVF